MDYPDIQSYAYSFQHAELSIGARIFTAIAGVEIDQPTEEGVVMGTRPYPLKRTAGQMEMGEGTITFSDEGERQQFIDELGNGYREKIWSLTWVLSGPNAGSSAGASIKKECIGCRVLSDPTSHESGTDALGGDITFSFMYCKTNGKAPHTGLP